MLQQVPGIVPRVWCMMYPFTEKVRTCVSSLAWLAMGCSGDCPPLFPPNSPNPHPAPTAGRRSYSATKKKNEGYAKINTLAGFDVGPFRLFLCSVSFCVCLLTRIPFSPAPQPALPKGVREMTSGYFLKRQLTPTTHTPTRQSTQLHTRQCLPMYKCTKVL